MHMPGVYQDESVPFGKNGRRDNSFDRECSYGTSGYRASGSTWKFITEEELYGGYRKGRAEAAGRSAPEKIRSLLEMTAQYEVEEEKRTSAFLKQAEFMADYEDDYRMRGVPIRHIFTAYQELNVDELRGYFSWRSRIRRGEKVSGGRDFIRLYAAEMVNLIGVSSPQTAFENLLRVRASADPDAKGDASLKGVLRDFCIAYELDHDLALAYCISDPETEAANLALSAADTADDHSLYAAVRTIVGDQIDSSRFLPLVEEDACHVIARTVRTVSANERFRKGKGITDRLLGVRKGMPHTMFAWLPYRTMRPDGYRYEVDPVRSYEYTGGKWSRSCYSSWRNPDEIRALSELVRECERLLRKALHYKNALPDRRRDPGTAKLISDIIEEWLKEKAERNKPEVRIDLTRLSDIRAAADITRDRLLEGTEDADEGLGETDPLWAAMTGAYRAESHIPGPNLSGPGFPEPTQELMLYDQNSGLAESGCESEHELQQKAEIPAQGASSVFTPEESAFLQLLLDEKPWKEYINQKHLMLSVFIDQINEKAYDELGDIILETENGTPELVEDYVEDVRAML